MKKIIIALLALLIVLGFAIKSCEADEFWDRVKKAERMVSNTETMISKTFSMWSDIYIKQFGRAKYEDMIFESGICPLCRKEK